MWLIKINIFIADKQCKYFYGFEMYIDHQVKSRIFLIVLSPKKKKNNNIRRGLNICVSVDTWPLKHTHTLTQHKRPHVTQSTHTHQTQQTHRNGDHQPIWFWVFWLPFPLFCRPKRMKWNRLSFSLYSILYSETIQYNIWSRRTEVSIYIYM